MLTIRARQLEAFQCEHDRQFVIGLSALVRRRHPVRMAAWTDVELHSALERAWRKAAQYGIGDPFALAEFFAAMVEQAPDFDKHPAVQAILGDPAIAPDHRIHAVWARIGTSTWEDIRRSASHQLSPTSQPDAAP